MENIAIRVFGRVQGVGFRYHTRQVAKENNINGIVKNMHDGSVYIEASGKEPDVAKFLNWCHKGPQWAYVESVEVSELPNKGYSGFVISG